MTINARIAGELGIAEHRVEAVLALCADGCTTPFIARYRKEATGNLDEVAIADIRTAAARIEEIEKRRAAILASCEERGVLTDALRSAIESAETMAVLEDVYLPYRPKRRTRASVAKERGLEPLAARLIRQSGGRDVDLASLAARFVNPKNGIETADDALDGARDIVAEAISEQPAARARMRSIFGKRATVAAKPAKGAAENEAAQKYRDYFDTETPVTNAPSHRILALFRAERENFLKLTIAPPETDAINALEGIFVRGDGPESGQVREAIRDGYKRLLAPSMETELRETLKTKADNDAIRVFAKNLSTLLMAPPLGAKRVLAIDPGFRTGCKLAVLDEHGAFLHHDTIYPHPPQPKETAAASTIRNLIETYGIEAVAIGNGTAGRETDTFVRKLTEKMPNAPVVVMANESGASIYSASDVAREEFPDQDITVRGAISIGRRLQDPLAELVKIDAKSIGVGQYQHDVDQGRLRAALDEVVERCVNQVGVELNSASRELLSYVSGLNKTLAANIVKYRTENGAFRSRRELKDIPRLGPKAFEQCAGFLRIRGADNPLDASAVHPENYHIVERMASDLGVTVRDLTTNAELREKIDAEKYIGPSAGKETLADIMSELAKPGRDPRSEFTPFAFSPDVKELTDLAVGMSLPGIVTNVTDFGAFVDVGVHTDGLIHRSKLRKTRLSPGDRTTVTVLDVDLPRKRISLGLAEEKGE